MGSLEGLQPDRQRVDKWLFFARVVKSRTLAAKLAQGGHIRINREKTGQASQSVKPGDVLTITLDRRILVLKVLAVGTRRGPAPEARLLYEDLSPPRVTTPPSDGQRAKGDGRPEKRDRRQIERFKRGLADE